MISTWHQKKVLLGPKVTCKISNFLIDGNFYFMSSSDGLEIIQFHPPRVTGKNRGPLPFGTRALKAFLMLAVAR